LELTTIVNNQQLIANVEATRSLARNAAKKATLALNQLKGRQDKDSKKISVKIK
jgi:hypothetical protein